jgi:hypothetical protein
MFGSVKVGVEIGMELRELVGLKRMFEDDPYDDL